MNIGSVDPNFTGSRALAGPGNAQPTIGSGNIWYTSGNFITKQSRQTKSVQPLSFYLKNFDALDKSSTQFDLGTNFFFRRAKSQHNIQQDLFTLLHLIPQDQKENS
jgi:hypothetical protein